MAGANGTAGTVEIALECWGDFACWSAPYGKVERLSYPFPTPSAVRGIYAAIYNKPMEFYWQVTRIEVLNPIRYISFKCNEVKKKVKDKVIYADEERTQRQTVALRDVRYRFSAVICPRESFRGTLAQLNEQALRRIRGGKAFFTSLPWACGSLWAILRRATTSALPYARIWTRA